MRLILLLSRLLGSSRVLRFLISGGTALLINLLTLYFVADVLHVWYLTASIIAFIVTFAVSFSMQKLWTFKERTSETIYMQVGLSFVVAGGNLLLNTFLMYIFVEHFLFHHILAQIIASALIACESFFLYKHVVFVVRAKDAVVTNITIQKT